jgi:hypothetical protein
VSGISHQVPADAKGKHMSRGGGGRVPLPLSRWGWNYFQMSERDVGGPVILIIVRERRKDWRNRF